MDESPRSPGALASAEDQAPAGVWVSIPWAPGFSDGLPALFARLAAPGRVDIRFATGDAVRNATGAAHGGFLAAMAEQTLFLPIFLGGQTDQFGCVTVDYGVHYLSLASTGEDIVGEVELLKLTGRMAFVRGIFRQTAGIVASYTGTLRHGLGRKADGERQK